MVFSFPKASSDSSSKPLFGSANPSTSTPLFGNTTASSSSASLFGAATSAPSGSLFGAAPPTPAATPSTTSATTAFGSTTPAPANNLGSLFANAAKQNAGPTATTLASTSAAPTTAAAPFSGFAQPSTAPSSTPSSQPAASTPSLFQNTATANTPSAPGAFSFLKPAATAPATTSASSSAFGLGGTAGSGSTPSSLFGNPAAATSAATPQIPSISVLPPSNSSSATSLFPQTASNPPSASQFANSATTASKPALFASSNTASATGPNLFGPGGGALNTKPNPFGAPAAQPVSSGPAPLFASLGHAGPLGGSLQSQNQSQQQQEVVPGVKIDISNIKPTTRFYELHESLQKDILAADEFIQKQIDLITQCNVFMPAHGSQLKTIPTDVQFVQAKYDTLTHALERDAAEINAVKDVVSADIEDARRTFTATESLKLPAQFQYGQMWASSADGESDSNVFASTDMVPYFDTQAAALDARLQRYAQQVREIEAHLRTVEAGAGEQMHRLLRRQAGEDAGRERVLELAGAMQVFEDAVLRVAAKVGEGREAVVECSLGGQVNGVNGSARR